MIRDLSVIVVLYTGTVHKVKVTLLCDRTLPF